MLVAREIICEKWLYQALPRCTATDRRWRGAWWTLGRVLKLLFAIFIIISSIIITIIINIISIYLYSKYIKYSLNLSNERIVSRIAIIQNIIEYIEQ